MAMSKHLEHANHILSKRVSMLDIEDILQEPLPCQLNEDHSNNTFALTNTQAISREAHQTFNQSSLNLDKEIRDNQLDQSSLRQCDALEQR